MNGEPLGNSHGLVRTHAFRRDNGLARSLILEVPTFADYSGTLALSMLYSIVRLPLIRNFDYRPTIPDEFSEPNGRLNRISITKKLCRMNASEIVAFAAIQGRDHQSSSLTFLFRALRQLRTSRTRLTPKRRSSRLLHPHTHSKVITLVKSTNRLEAPKSRTTSA